ncbi:MAG: hypothetical protein R2909_14840 [Gemmatimonadales bacterium]
MFRLKDDASLAFPARARVTFHFQPMQPFGIEAGGGRTAVRAKAASVRFNANTGHHYIESKEPLTPLEVTIVGPNDRVELRGNALTIDVEVATLKDLHELVEGYYFVAPMLLGLYFVDPPYVERVGGTIGTVQFRWELSEWSAEFTTTTQEEQEQAVASALGQLSVVADPSRRRLLAAVHYAHTAARLTAASSTPGEFLAEAVLNYAKVLEVLFPPGKDVRTLDAARSGLVVLGYSEATTESEFIPALVLRNGFDSGHPDLTIFTPRQLGVIHAYSERADASFRELLRRVLAKAADGTYSIAPGSPSRPDAAELRVLERLEAAAEKPAG